MLFITQKKEGTPLGIPSFKTNFKKILFQQTQQTC